MRKRKVKMAIVIVATLMGWCEASAQTTISEENASITVCGEMPTSGSMITGVVKSPSGTIKGARVMEFDKRFGNIVASTTTDESGAFSFELINPDNSFRVEYAYGTGKIDFKGDRFEVFLFKDKIDLSEFEGLGMTPGDGPRRGSSDYHSLDVVPPTSPNLQFKASGKGTAVFVKKQDNHTPTFIIPAVTSDVPQQEVTEVAAGALFQCGLEEVDISKNVSIIGDCAFRNNKLKSVVLRSSKPVACPENAFDESAYENALLYVPKGWKQKRAAKVGPAWGKFKHVEFYEK